MTGTIGKNKVYEAFDNLMYGFGCRLLAELDERSKCDDELYTHTLMTHGSVIGIVYAYDAMFGKDDNYKLLKESCDKIIKDTLKCATHIGLFDGED